MNNEGQSKASDAREEAGGRETGAVLSDCGRYRYRLWRRWDDAAKSLIFVMLNPSTADADADDPTIRKCVGFAKRWGYGAIVVFNLFAFRATDPKDCRGALDRKGPDNDRHLLDAFAFARSSSLPVIGAWGKAEWAQPRARTVQLMARGQGVTMLCLDKNKDGSPKHPLYVPYDVLLKTLTRGAPTRHDGTPGDTPGPNNKIQDSVGPGADG